MLTSCPGNRERYTAILELRQALAHASERFQAMDEAGMLRYVSDHYRADPLPKAAIREQLRVMFALYDTRTAGERVWVYSKGAVSGRLRWLGTWTPILSWQHEPEVAQREQGVWRLYGYQQWPSCRPRSRSAQGCGPSAFPRGLPMRGRTRTVQAIERLGRSTVPRA